MSKRQTRKMLSLMAGGEPVELASPMATIRRLARLAFIAEQFGYLYAGARVTGGSRNRVIKMTIVPDPSPQARQRAAENWARYPQAGDGVSLPPYDERAVELLKARIKFDLASNYTVLATLTTLTIVCGLLVARHAGDSGVLVAAVVLWVLGLVVAGIMIPVNRQRMRNYASLLQAAGFVQVRDEKGRERYVPPGTQFPGQPAPGFHGAQPQPGGNPFAQQQQPYAAQPPQQQQYAQPQQQQYAQPPQQQPYAQPQQPGYGYPPPAAGPYGAQQSPYPQQQQPPSAAPYAPQPQNPYGGNQNPHQGYGQQGQQPYGGQ